MKWKDYVKQLNKQDKSWLPDFAQEALRLWVSLDSMDEFMQWTLTHPKITAAVFDILGYPDLDGFLAPVSVDLSAFQDTLWYRRIDLDGVPFIKKAFPNDPSVGIIVYPNKAQDGIELKAVRIPEVQFERAE